MSEIVHGSDVLVYKSVDSVYYLVGCAFSCTFSFRNEIIGKTDNNAGLFRKRRVRISDCSGVINGLTKVNNTGSLSVFHFLEEGVRRSEGDYKIVYTDSDGNTKILTMTCIIETVNIVSDFDGLSEFDLSIQATGGFETDPLDPPAVECDTWDSDWWATTPGATSLSGNSNGGKSFAGKTILEVDRDGTQIDILSVGTPGNRQCTYTGSASIDFDPNNPFNSGETVFIIWLV